MSLKETFKNRKNGRFLKSSKTNQQLPTPFPFYLSNFSSFFFQPTTNKGFENHSIFEWFYFRLSWITLPFYDANINPNNEFRGTAWVHSFSAIFCFSPIFLPTNSSENQFSRIRQDNLLIESFDPTFTSTSRWNSSGRMIFFFSFLGLNIKLQFHSTVKILKLVW